MLHVEPKLVDFRTHANFGVRPLALAVQPIERVESLGRECGELRDALLVAQLVFTR